MIPITLTNCHNMGCKTKVDEDLEEGEIIEEIDSEHFKSTEQNTELRVHNDNLLTESVKEKHSKPPLDVRSHDMFPQKMIHDPLPMTSRFNISWPRQNWISRNKSTIIKQDVEDQMDTVKPWCKKLRFDNSDKKQLILRNYQNGLFNTRINYDTPVEPMEAGNDEEISNSRGNNIPNISNFESFPQQFENEKEFCSVKKFSSRKRKFYGFNVDRSSRGNNIKQWMITGSDMKNEQSDVGKKICKYFLKGKCFKEDSCAYAHEKLNDPQMKLCKNYLSSYCMKENKCTFMHSDFPCKYYHTGVKCYSGKNCRLSHAKIDDDKKYIYQKLFGQLCDNPEYTQNKYEETQIPLTKNNFVTKNNDIKIPSILEMQIPVLLKSKSTEKNSNEYLENNHNNNNIHTPMSQPPLQEEPIVDNTLIYQNYEYNDKNKTGKQENEFREEQKEERQKEPNKEKNGPYINEFFMQTTVLIDEGISQNDDNYQFELLPNKQKQLFKRIQSHQKKYIEIDMSEDSFIQEKRYSSDVSEYSVSNSMNNALNIAQNEEKELPSLCFSSKSNLSDVKEVHLYEANNHVLAKLPSIKSCVNKSTIEIHPYPLEIPNDFEETIQDEISSIKEFPISPKYKYNCAIELGKEDSDLRQLTFTFPITTATEINASIDNHLPMKYHMLPIEVPVLDYSKITSMIRIDDPRHRHGIKSARNLTFIQNIPATVSAVSIRPAVTPQKIASRDPRKRQKDINTFTSAIHVPFPQTPYPAVTTGEIVSRDPRKQHKDINTFTSAIHAPLLQTPYPYQPYSMDIDMRYIVPQIMAMTNNPSTEPINFVEPSNDM